jgi:hypothetical protein
MSEPSWATMSPLARREKNPRLRPPRHHQSVRRFGGPLWTGPRRLLPRRRTVEFLAFMDQVAATYPDDHQLHVIMDNLSTHSGDDVDAWLQREPALHADRKLVGEHGRDLARDHHPPGHPKRHVHFVTPPHTQDQGLRPPLERRRDAVRVDRHTTGHHRQNGNTPTRLPEAARQQLQVNDHNYETLATTTACPTLDVVRGPPCGDLPAIHPRTGSIQDMSWIAAPIRLSKPDFPDASPFGLPVDRQS